MVDPISPRSPLSAPVTKGTAADMTETKRKAVAKDFETVFLGQMVDQMMKTVKLGNMDGGHAQELWRSFLSHAIAEQISQSGTTGIARSVEHMLQAYGTKGPTT